MEERRGSRKEEKAKDGRKEETKEDGRKEAKAKEDLVLVVKEAKAEEYMILICGGVTGEMIGMDGPAGTTGRCGR